MVRKLAAIGLALLGAWSCATPPSGPPAFFVGDIPADVSTRLRLDDRIAVKEAWDALKAGRAEQARKLVSKLGAASPAYAVGLAYTDLLLGDLAAAEAGFKTSLRSFPDMTSARIGLAQIYESRRESEKVLGEYREILKTDPDNRWAKPRFEALRDDLVKAGLTDARIALAAGDREAAKRGFLKVLFYAPETMEAHLDLARIYRQEKNPASALLHFKAAMEGRTVDKAVLKEYAEYLADSGELGQSLDVLEKLAALEPREEAVGKRIEELKTKLGIYELPSQYAEIPALEAIARQDLAALIGVKFGDLLDSPAKRTEILVDISMSWAQRYIVKVASLDIMSVFDNHTFQPRRIINRAELADTAVRLIGVLQSRGAKFVPLVEARRIQVADVAADNYYGQAIIRALSFQIMTLTPGRMFEPERTVPGNEAIRIMDLILRLAR
ncbi:MAG: S-layer homology domain-containing protein [Candidatus Aminicenantes bacterium]|nr:S-layer homology domain-containing protein [Candidatus Aminicenantes bacterium]